MADDSVILGGVALAVAGVVWLVRLEGRINLGDSNHLNIVDDIAEIKADVKLLLIKPLTKRGLD